jgi:hypothetical protein
MSGKRRWEKVITLHLARWRKMTESVSHVKNLARSAWRQRRLSNESTRERNFMSSAKQRMWLLDKFRLALFMNRENKMGDRWPPREIYHCFLRGYSLKCGPFNFIIKIQLSISEDCITLIINRYHNDWKWFFGRKK